MFQTTSKIVCATSLWLAASCSSPKSTEAQPPNSSSGRDSTQQAAPDAPAARRKTEPEKPWTTRFAVKAALVADEVTIEGPPGLLNHVVVQQNEEFFVHETRATPDGLVLSTTLKEGVEGAPPIRVRLDAWTIDALTRVRVLERPGEAPVVVQLAGDAWYRELETGAEERSAVLRFVGERP